MIETPSTLQQFFYIYSWTVLKLELCVYMLNLWVLTFYMLVLYIQIKTKVKFRSQCFFEKFRQKFFYNILISFKKILEILSCLEVLNVTKFKENVQIYVITFKKVHDLLLTLLQVITTLVTYKLICFFAHIY